MPELPEVETVVRGLVPLLEGQRIGSVEVRRPDLRWPIPEDLRQRLTGATVTGLSRRAKYGLIATDRGDTLLFHLGMSGRFRLDPADLLPNDHVILEVGGHRLSFHDPRRFGSLHLAATADLAAHPTLSRLGPEPLSDDFTGAHLRAAAARRLTAVKSLLLDQSVVAGIGNIYACEALFRAGINPARKAGNIAGKRLSVLVEELRAVLVEAIEAGGSTLRDHAQVSGDLGYFQHRFRVYGRAGEPCPSCGAAIRRRVQAGRSTFSCPRCQR
jgi:formamidopyrimidine-DNA glycosylase